MQHQKRYIVILYNSYGCNIASEYSNEPYELKEWVLERGDTIKVIDTQGVDYYHNYKIAY